MKINRIEIESFMGLSAQLDTTQPINVFFGHNGVGKSAVLDALYWAFIWTCPQRGIKHLKDGTMLATNGLGDVSVDCFTEEGQVHRSFRNGKDAKFGPSLIFKPDDIAILLHPAKTLRMDAKSRQAVLGRLFRDDATVAKLDECLKKHAIGPEARTKALEDLDKAQDWAVTRRREAKRSVTDLTAAQPELPSLIVEIDGDSCDLTKNSLADMLNVLQDRQQQRVAKQQEMQHVAATVDIERVKILLAKNQLDLEELVRRQTEQEAKSAGPAPKVAEADRKKRDAWTKASELATEMKAAEKALESVRQIKELCPTCRRVLTKANQKKLLETLKHDAKVAAGKSATAHQNYQGAEKEHAALRKQQDALAGEQERALRQIDLLKDQIAAAQDQISQAETAEPAREKLQGEITDLDRRIANLTALADAKRSYQEAIRTRANLTEQIASRRQDIETMDKLDALLKPDGELRQIVNQDLANLEFDEPLSKAWGMETLTIRPDGEIRLYQRPLEMASVTERWRASVLIAEMLSRAIGAGILVLDGMDVLTDTRGALQGRLDDWKDRYDTILLNVAVQEPPTEPAPDGWAYWWVGDGTVKPLTAVLEEVA